MAESPSPIHGVWQKRRHCRQLKMFVTAARGLRRPRIRERLVVTHSRRERRTQSLACSACDSSCRHVALVQHSSTLRFRPSSTRESAVGVSATSDQLVNDRHRRDRIIQSAAAIGSRWMSHLQLAQLGSKQWSCPRTVLPISVMPATRSARSSWTTSVRTATVRPCASGSL